MNPLHDYVARSLAEKLKTRGVVVWYDPNREFGPFIAAVRGNQSDVDGAKQARIGGVEAWLFEYNDSMFELRLLVEPRVCGDSPEAVLVYLPGIERDDTGSPLKELETGGICYEPTLKRVAREALRASFGDGQIDGFLRPQGVGYVEISRLFDDSGDVSPSHLKSIFHGISSPIELIATWLADRTHDDEIITREATQELALLVTSRLGLAVAADVTPQKLQAITLRYVLAGEFRSDLACPPPSRLESVPLPPNQRNMKAVGDVAKYLRSHFAEAYPALADRVEGELALASAGLPAEALGSIDTFRFEERALLGHSGDLIVAGKFDEALTLVSAREGCFWLNQDIARRAQWEACGRMAELGREARAIQAQLAQFSGDAQAWIDAYTDAKSGWYALDQAQRRLEALIAGLADEPIEQPLAVARRAYEEACGMMATGFVRALEKAGWSIASTLHQTRAYSEAVSAQPKPVAYFLVDALRYEMGVELVDRLAATAEISIRPALGALPSITPIGMAALMPGASTSFSVVDREGRLGTLIDDAFMQDQAARRKWAAARVPKLVDITLDEVLSASASKLGRKITGAPVVIVRSQEIDSLGESGHARTARPVMDNAIQNIARAIEKLAKAGVQNAVVAADHGHLFFAADRDDSMKIDAPGGTAVGLHRRCWIGRGGAVPQGCVRVAARALGYDSDLDFIFPSGTGVFKGGGDLAYYHGGPSLQEVIIPVVTVRSKAWKASSAKAESITVSNAPPSVTNRIFTVTVRLGGETAGIFTAPMTIRPLLIADGKQVGGLAMVAEANFDRATGTLELPPDKAITLAFLLSDDTPKSLRIVIQDSARELELYRSPLDIPIELIQ